MKRFVGLVIILASAAIAAGYQPSKTGWLKIQLPDLPQPEHKSEKLLYNYNPKQELFEIYIPPDYKAEEKYGVLGWVDPEAKAEIPRQFEPLMKEYKLIGVTAARSGNDQDPARRIGLLECAITELSKTLNIDLTRVVMSGYSGGGRTSAMACFLHSEFWQAAISWVGGNFYKEYSVEKPVGGLAPGINDYNPGLVTHERIKRAKEHAKFVLISGDKDYNFHDTRGIYRALKRESFQAYLIEQPGLAHEVGSTESMKEALEYVFNGKEKDD